MEENSSKPILLKPKLLLNNSNEKFLFSNNSNITGISFPKFLHTTQHKALMRSNSYSNNINHTNMKNNKYRKTEINFYSSLKGEEKLDYINKLISNSLKKDSFDYMALKRKKFSLIELINQTNISEKMKKFEDNKICKIPYPLIYCITNRKFENNSSNLLTKILTKENNNLSHNQELTIKYSEYSKIFNTDISKLINDEKKISSTPKISRDNLPILNKYLKQKFNKFNLKNINLIKYASYISNTPNYIKININKGFKRYGSNAKNLKKIRKDNDEFKNVFDSYKNKSMNLFNHKNSMKNLSMIKERYNKMMEEKFMRNKKIKMDPKVNKIIKDVSHLKFNNQIMPFSHKVNDI